MALSVLLPNAWFYHTAPTLAGIVFVAIGAYLLIKVRRGDRDNRGRKYDRSTGCLGAVVIAVGGSVALGILIFSPTPWHRQRIFDHVYHTPPQDIERFVIHGELGDQNRPLTRRTVVIDDPAAIRRIADVLAASHEVWPNHPQTRWNAEVEIVTRSGSYYFNVTATESGDANGTLVNARATKEPGGWNLGDSRADGLERLLEEALATPAAP